MNSWSTFVQEAPELAAATRARFEAATHHILATVRKDGSPRVSGTEVDFYREELAIGSMHRSMKALDLLRDGRFALHSNPGADASMTGGDAKVSGRAEEITAQEEESYRKSRPVPPGEFHLFRLIPTEVVLTSLTPDQDALLIRLWRPGRSLREFHR